MTCKRIVHLMSRQGLALLLCLTAGIRPGIAAADLGSSFKFDIPAQPLPYALLKYSEQSGVQVTSPGKLLEKRSSSGVVGTFEAKDALRRLLAGTDLGYDVVDRNTVVITSSARPGAQQPQSREGAQGHSLWGQFRVARSNLGQIPGSAEVGGDAKEPAAAAANLEEVVVTAQKRKERLIEVPVPVTAVSAGALIDSNELRLQDYYTSVPGLDLTLDNRGSPVISIRGVTTSFYTSGSTPTVGITIDDVPYENTGPSTFSPIPDIDPNELERVEVLRGPQGTLYGSSSIGGLVKYVTIDPSTDRVSGYASAGLTAVKNGHKQGYNASAGVNLPLNDSVALRASGFTHDDPGYIDNVQTGQQGVNDRKVYGGRISGLWRPSDSFSLKLGALYQDSKGYGPSQIDVPTPGYTLPRLGDLQQSNLIGTGGYDRRIQGYSANIDARLGAARLISVTGYDISRSSDSFDFTYVFGPFTQMKFGVAGTAFAEDNTARKFSQELRLSLPLGSMVDWLLGAFYTHEQTTPVGGMLRSILQPACRSGAGWISVPPRHTPRRRGSPT